MELEVDSLRRQLEYLDQLEQEEEEQRLIEQESKVSGRQGWKPSIISEESEDKHGGSNHSKSGHGAGRQRLQEQMKPQLPPGIQIGNSQKLMSPSASSGAFPIQQSGLSSQMLSPRGKHSDSLKKNSSAVALSPRGRPEPKPTRPAHTHHSPPPISPRLGRQPSESINVSPIRRVNQGSGSTKATNSSQEMNIVGRAHQMSEVKPSQRRKHHATPSSNCQNDSSVPSDTENDTKQHLQKQSSRSVLKNVNLRLVMLLPLHAPVIFPPR